MALKPKRIFFWLHLVTGLVCGLFIALLALTGASIAYGPQLIEAAQSEVTHIAVVPGATKLPIEELLKKAGEQVPGLTPAGVTVFSDGTRAVMIAGGRGKPSYHVNPYTGEVKEQGAKKTRAFIDFMTGLHRWLALSDSAREVGKTVTGVAALGFAFVCVTGLVVWWPRQLKLRVMKPSLWFIRGATGKLRDWNRHNVLGFWSLPVIATLAVTGAMIAFPWARGLLYYAVGEKPPVRREAPAKPEAKAPRREGDASAPDSARGAEGGVSEKRKQSGGNEGPPEASAGRPEGPARPVFSPPMEGTGPMGYDSVVAAVTEDFPAWESVSLVLGGENRRDGGMRRESSPGGEGAARAPRPEGASPAEGEAERPRRRRDGGRRSAGLPALSVRVKRSDTAPLFAQVVYSLNPYTGEVLTREGFGDKSLGEKLGGSVRNVHTGEGFGRLGQTVMALGCLVTLVLVYTGFALSWRRFFPGKKARHHQHRGDGGETPVFNSPHEGTPPASE